MTTHAQPETDTNHEVKDFAVLLMEHLNGRTHTEISHEIHALLAAVTAHGKKGSLTIRIDVEPSSAVDGSPISIAFDTVLKAPKATAPRALFFLDENGNAVRNDPRQQSFDFRTAPANTELRSI